MPRPSTLLAILLVAAPAARAMPVQRDRAQDASADRGFLAPHAQTLPQGTGAFNAYEIVLMGLSYAPTDHVQISAAAPFFIPVIGLAHVKAVIARGDRTILSVGGALLYGTSLDAMVGGGPLIDLHLGPDGVVSLHGAAGVYLGTGGRDAFDVRFAEEGTLRDPIMVDGGLMVRIGHNVKVGGEAKVIWESGFPDLGAVLYTAGFRVHEPSWALDLAFTFIRTLSGDEDEEESGLDQPLPFLALAIRF